MDGRTDGRTSRSVLWVTREYQLGNSNSLHSQSRLSFWYSKGTFVQHAGKHTKESMKQVGSLVSDIWSAIDVTKMISFQVRRKYSRRFRSFIVLEMVEELLLVSIFDAPFWNFCNMSMKPKTHETWNQWKLVFAPRDRKLRNVNCVYSTAPHRSMKFAIHEFGNKEFNILTW